ncbi:hypothetical protein [Streptomyces sp. NPDC001889]
MDGASLSARIGPPDRERGVGNGLSLLCRPRVRALRMLADSFPCIRMGGEQTPEARAGPAENRAVPGRCRRAP